MGVGRQRVRLVAGAAFAIAATVLAPLAHGDDAPTSLPTSSTSSTSTTEHRPTTTTAPPPTTTGPPQTTAPTVMSTPTTATGTTTTTTLPSLAAGVVAAPASVDDAAVRLPSMQLTDTLPPPSFTTTGPGDSLEVPANSGEGRRIVYSKTVMRVWMIEADGTIFHTHRVSGLMSQPKPGTYSVWSRSPTTCSRNHSDICMRWMVRFAFSARGDNIGFHEIPRRNGVPMQDISELGLALSAGCVRQATDDAIVTWNWAQLGTVVVVVG